MKNLKKSTISEMTPEDAFKIASWDEKFGSEKEFESIKKYLNFETQMLAEDLQFSGKPSNITQPLTLADILDGYHFAEIENPDYDPSDAIHLAYVMKNSNDEIVLFSLLHFRDLPSHFNPLDINALVVHPKYQNQGYATKFLSEIFKNPAKYFGAKPDEFVSIFGLDNEAAKKLFSKFGFSLEESSVDIEASTHSPKLLTESQPGSNG